MLISFSGFGLGTILVPVIAIFFPVDIDIALTGVIYFCSNPLKILLDVKKTDRDVLIHFGIPAILTSFIGAFRGQTALKWKFISGMNGLVGKA